MNNTPYDPKNANPTSRTVKNKAIVSDKRKKQSSPSKDDIQKLKLLVTIVDRTKADYYMDLLQAFDINAQMSVAAQGTATTEMLHYLGLSGVSTDKSVIFSVVRENMVKETDDFFRYFLWE